MSHDSLYILFNVDKEHWNKNSLIYVVSNFVSIHTGFVFGHRHADRKVKEGIDQEIRWQSGLSYRRYGQTNEGIRKENNRYENLQWLVQGKLDADDNGDDDGCKEEGNLSCDYDVMRTMTTMAVITNQNHIFRFMLLFLAIDFCRFCVIIRFFPSPPQRQMTFGGFSITDFIHYIYFPILILEKETVFPFLMFSARQWNYLVPFL